MSVSITAFRSTSVGRCSPAISKNPMVQEYFYRTEVLHVIFQSWKEDKLMTNILSTVTEQAVSHISGYE